MVSIFDSNETRKHVRVKLIVVPSDGFCLKTEVAPGVPRRLRGTSSEIRKGASRQFFRRIIEKPEVFLLGTFEFFKNSQNSKQKLSKQKIRISQRIISEGPVGKRSIIHTPA
ncbi:unnamed protein product, partial [Nesidiocoris tenuis]